MNVSNYLFSFYIKVCSSSSRNSDIIELIEWKGYPFELFMKWQWYFEYRYALLRLKYPKNHIEKREIKYEDNIGSIVLSKRNKIVKKKAIITSAKNKLSQYEKNWNSMFPISEDILFVNTANKIKELENELQEMINDFSQHLP